MATQKKESLAGKYLTFRLDDEDYGIEILRVQEIIQMQRITKLPKASSCLLGVINIRGKIIPVVSLRSALDMMQGQDTDKTCIVVAQITFQGSTKTVGLVVDEVKEVMDIPESQIEKAPNVEGVNSAFILGLVKGDGAVKILIDIDQLMVSAGVETLDTEMLA